MKFPLLLKRFKMFIFKTIICIKNTQQKRLLLRSGFELRTFRYPGVCSNLRYRNTRRKCISNLSDAFHRRRKFVFLSHLIFFLYSLHKLIIKQFRFREILFRLLRHLHFLVSHHRQHFQLTLHRNFTITVSHHTI